VPPQELAEGADRGSVATLVAKNVAWYCQLDEELFFEWLARIGAVVHLHGHGRELEITLDVARLDDKGLRELIGLFARYDLDMRQLAVLRDDAKRPWFSQRETASWHERVFGGIGSQASGFGLPAETNRSARGAREPRMKAAARALPPRNGSGSSR
jgi:hypothetical protein